MTEARGLRVRDLRVRIGSDVVLDVARLDVAPGERLAVVGPSGGGKSMLAAAVAGTLPAAARAEGVVTVGESEHDLGAGPARRRRARRRARCREGVALVRQDSTLALHPLRSIGSQVALGAHAAAPGAVAALLEQVDLPADAVDRLPLELSGGQRQRAAIALGIACGAGLLIADEPTTALDGPSQARVLRALAGVPATLVLITHDLAVAAEICDRVVVLDAGRVVDDLPLADLLAGGGGPTARALAADLPRDVSSDVHAEARR